MKGLGFTVLVVIVTQMLVSCVSLNDREMNANEQAQVDVLGSVTVTFNSFQVFNVPNKNRIKQKAHLELLRVARQKYQGNIEIRNITINGGWSNLQLLSILGYLGGIGMFIPGISMAIVFDGINKIDDYFDDGRILPTAPYYSLAGVGLGLLVSSGNTQKITATGDVVLLRSETNILESALDNAYKTIIDVMPRNATIAILNVYSQDLETAEYVIDGLEHKLVDSRKFQIVDRRRLEQIRREQNFQMSGEVDDNTAISIGNLLGANIVITGDIGGSGASRRLVLRALDVRTGQIVTMARERF